MIVPTTQHRLGQQQAGRTDSHKQNELSFAKGDKMTILQRDEEAGWWAAELNGKKGFAAQHTSRHGAHEQAIQPCHKTQTNKQVGLFVLRAA